MARRKTKKRKTRGSFLGKVQRSPGVKSVRNRIKRKKAELKKLSGEYKRQVKKAAKRLKKK